MLMQSFAEKITSMLTTDIRTTTDSHTVVQIPLTQTWHLQYLEEVHMDKWNAEIKKKKDM